MRISKTSLKVAACLIGLLLGAPGLSARERPHHRHGKAVHHGHNRTTDGTGIRAVGRVVPIVAGSDKVRVDSAGQVITDRQP